MAKIFRPKTSKSTHASKNKHRKHKSLAKQLPDFLGEITHYDHEGKGICQGADGRIAFISGAMQGESVKVRPTTYTDKIIKGNAIDVVRASDKRQEPHCKYFGECGGCQLQYMDSDEQLNSKQSGLEPQLQRQLKLQNVPWQSAISGNEWHYRRSSRLAIWFNKDGSFNLGFRKSKSKDIIDIDACPVLAKSLSELLPDLKQLIAQLENKKSITHIQLFSLTDGDAIIFRVVSELSSADKDIIKAFAASRLLHILLEHNEQNFEAIFHKNQLDSDQSGTLLEYVVNEIRYQFLPNNFIQVNEGVNQKMLAQALEWLDIKKTDRVLDLFSGVGNFTLPIAQRAEQVFAVEGVNSMVKQLKQNAELNQMVNVSAFQADLSKLNDKNRPKWLKPIDKLLLDPARDGAFDVVKKIPLLKPKQILYVSCNPTTLIRDIKVLQDARYTLKKIGLLNMFPHTSHMEAMALLEYK